MEQEEVQPQSNHAESPTIIYKVLYFILGIIEILLATRFILLFLGANLYAGFSQLIKALTDPFMAPFQDLFPVVEGDVMTFSLSILAAMGVYALIFYGIIKLIRIIRSRKK